MFSVEFILCRFQLPYTIILRLWSWLWLGNSSVVEIYIIRPKPGPVAKNATPIIIFGIYIYLAFTPAWFLFAWDYIIINNIAILQ